MFNLTFTFHVLIPVFTFHILTFTFTVHLNFTLYLSHLYPSPPHSVPRRQRVGSPHRHRHPVRRPPPGPSPAFPQQIRADRLPRPALPLRQAPPHAPHPQASLGEDHRDPVLPQDHRQHPHRETPHRYVQVERFLTPFHGVVALNVLIVELIIILVMCTGS
jgi:hypothetical protein